MKVESIPLGFALLAAGLPGALAGAGLQPGTLRAWDGYVETTDSAMQARLDGRRPFLWTDEAPERASRLQLGKTLVAPGAGHGTKNVPNGLIHHWVGAVFIPNATLHSLLSVVHDYDRYKDFYKPVVADSKTLNCSGMDERFSMIWQHRVLFVSAAIKGEYQARDFVVDRKRGYNIATTTEVREIESYGQESEHFLAPGQGNGFIWRLHSIARYEERDGGVYLELEAIALTRDIPASLRWMVGPVVNHLSVNSLATSLRQTREAVGALAQEPERLSSCANGATHAASLKASGDN